MYAAVIDWLEISMSKAIRFFTQSAGVILLATAAGKLVSANGSARILQIFDPILSITFRDVFVIISLIEIVVAFICLFGKQVRWQISLLVWLVTNFVIYRIGLFLIGYHKPCPCLGNFTDALYISQQTADTAMKIILAYLLIGSYTSLFWLWRQKRQAVSASAPSGPSAPSPAP